MRRLSYAEPCWKSGIHAAGEAEQAMSPGGIVSILGRGLRVYITPPLRRVSISLGLVAAYNAGTILYTEESLAPVVSAAAEAAGLGVEVRGCSECGGPGGVFLWCAPGSSPVLVAGYELRRPSSYGLRRLVVKRISPNIYLLELPGTGLKEYIEIRGHLPVPTKPPCMRDPLEALASVFGGAPAPIRDAVDVVSHAMGVKREEARRMLHDLAEKGCIEITREGMVKVRGPL